MLSSCGKQEAPTWLNYAVLAHQKLANEMRRLVCHMKKMTDTKL